MKNGRGWKVKMSKIRSCNTDIPEKNWDRIFGTPLQDFKIRVTPEQSRIVEKEMLNKGGEWVNFEKIEMIIQPTNKLFLLIENKEITFCSLKMFKISTLPELTFAKFQKQYCNKGGK